MGQLRRLKGEDSRLLLTEHLIGRGPECALRLPGQHVSSQHALIRWHGSGWELVDRASRNGTRLNGELLQPGRPHPVLKNAAITFGHADECWVLVDAGEPEVMVLALSDGAVLSGAQGIIGLPPGGAPSSTLFRDADGLWKLEAPDASVRLLSDGETITIGEQSFRFCLPTAAAATVDAGSASQRDEPALHFVVSSDEDFVELRVLHGQHTTSVGSRSHNYLLLTLARALLADIEAGHESASCGWMDKDDLAKGLRMSPEHVDGEVFRIRKHFARQGLRESASIIERRPRTKQMRLGLRNVRIERG